MVSNSHLPTQLSLPSWIPDATRINTETIANPYAFNASKNTRLRAYLSDDNSVLHVAGKEIDKITIMGSTTDEMTDIKSKRKIDYDGLIDQKISLRHRLGLQWARYVDWVGVVHFYQQFESLIDVRGISLCFDPYLYYRLIC